MNKNRRILINKIEERRWAILNGSFGKEGGWTYIGEIESSVIDYIVENDKAIEEIRMVEEGNKTESNHIPEVEIMGPKTSKKSGRNTVVEIERSNWTEEETRSYQENCSCWSCTDGNRSHMEEDDRKSQRINHQTEKEGFALEVRKRKMLR